MTTRQRTAWTFAVTSAALFMASLDNLVVTTALPSIREHLHASLEGLQWTVNAYTLTFAVLLLTGAALGERYGRRRMFTAGLALFTAGSAAAALAPGIGLLVAARAVQGVGAAIVIPLTLTLLSAAVSPQRRGLALGAWGAVGGLAIAIGPLVGGAVVEGASWQWIFWLNVPIGIALLPIARFRLTESRGSSTRLDIPGVVLASVGLLGIVLGVVRGNDHGWTSLTVLPSLVIGALLVAAFAAWELRAREPMLPLHLFRSRGFAVTNAASLLMFFGMFGSIFLLAQFLQVVQHYSPLQAPADAALDRHAGVHRPGRRRAVRPHRRSAAAGRRARPAGRRPGLAGRRGQSHRAVPDPGPGVRRRRRRDVPVLRAGCQRRAQLGAAGPGGDRLGSEQRDPGTGRRVRDRRARRGVLGPGRLRQRDRLRLRPGPRGLGRRGGGSRRRGGRPAPARPPRPARRPSRPRNSSWCANQPVFSAPDPRAGIRSTTVRWPGPVPASRRSPASRPAPPGRRPGPAARRPRSPRRGAGRRGWAGPGTGC